MHAGYVRFWVLVDFGKGVQNGDKLKSWEKFWNFFYFFAPREKRKFLKIEIFQTKVELDKLYQMACSDLFFVLI